jgi:hypothetical protein
MSIKKHISKIFTDIGQTSVSPELVLKTLQKHYNYTDKKLIEVPYNKLIIKNPRPDSISAAETYIKRIYKHLILDIKTYISWLNLFCFDYITTLKIDRKVDINITTIGELANILYRYCSIKDSNISRYQENTKLNTKAFHNLNTNDSMSNTLQLFLSTAKTNTSTKPSSNNSKNFIVLTNQFRETISIYYEHFAKFKYINISVFDQTTVQFNTSYHHNFKKIANFTLQCINELFKNRCDILGISIQDLMVDDICMKQTIIFKKIHNIINAKRNNIIDNILNNRTKNTNTPPPHIRYYHLALDTYDSFYFKTSQADFNSTEKKKVEINKYIASTNSPNVKPSVYLCFFSNDNKSVILFKDTSDKYRIHGDTINNYTDNFCYIPELINILQMHNIKLNSLLIRKDYSLINTKRIYSTTLHAADLANLTQIYNTATNSDTNNYTPELIKVDDILNKKNKLVDKDIIKYIVTAHKRRLYGSPGTIPITFGDLKPRYLWHTLDITDDRKLHIADGDITIKKTFYKDLASELKNLKKIKIKIKIIQNSTVISCELIQITEKDATVKLSDGTKVIHIIDKVNKSTDDYTVELLKIKKYEFVIENDKTTTVYIRNAHKKALLKLITTDNSTGITYVHYDRDNRIEFIPSHCKILKIKDDDVSSLTANKLIKKLRAAWNVERLVIQLTIEPLYGDERKAILASDKIKNESNRDNKLIRSPIITKQPLGISIIELNRRLVISAVKEGSIAENVGIYPYYQFSRLYKTNEFNNSTYNNSEQKFYISLNECNSKELKELLSNTNVPYQLELLKMNKKSRDGLQKEIRTSKNEE